MRQLILIPLLLFTLTTRAQNEVDALRYSWTGFGGSARYMGVAGGMAGIGGDLSVMATNPAGIARFTKSDFSISFAYSDFSSESIFHNQAENSGKGNFTLSQFGFVAAARGSEASDWKSIQFGIAYNKLSNLNQRIQSKGYNASSSLLDVFAADASGIPEQFLIDERPFTSGPAYFAYLIDPYDTVHHTYVAHLPPGSLMFQENTVTRSGGVNETDISFSGNYMDKLYLGFTLGFPSIRFNETFIHTESTVDSTLDLEEFDYRQDLTTRGTGINAKFGIMFLPTEWLRLGLAAHTASSISLSDRWDSEVHSRFRNGDRYTELSPLGFYNYRLKTPGRLIGSAGVILIKKGFLNVEYELVNYSRAKLKPHSLDGTGFSFAAENAAIQGNYQTTGNLRVGAEWRFKPVMVRAGYALYGSPFKSDVRMNDAVRKTTTFGIGYRNNYFYFDAAVVLNEVKEDHYFYSPELIDPASVTTKGTQIILSGGLRF